MRILVTGGAGYIGSHMVKLLVDRGEEVTVLDDLSTGHADAVRGAKLVRGDIAEAALTSRLLKENRTEGVIHFAAASLVAESVADPLKYYTRNVAGTAALVRAMREAGVGKLVFSSSAAVYGNPQRLPIDEAHPTEPVNPYGSTKLAMERMLAECCAAYGLSAAVLRYFNAAGADPKAGLGERHNPETHLIPLLLRAAAKDTPVSVFGTDYPTRDGTVLEVIAAARRVTGREIKVVSAARRAGDPPSLVADAAKAKRVLGWQPARADIETIVRDAWAFEQRRAG